MEAQSQGIRAFISTHSLSKEGAYLRVHPEFVEGDDATYDGKLVYIPPGVCFIQPWSMIHGGGFRTGPLGNPCLQVAVFLIPESKIGWWNSQKDVSGCTYIGIGDDDPRHDFEVINLTDADEPVQASPHPYMARRYLQDFLSEVAH